MARRPAGCLSGTFALLMVVGAVSYVSTMAAVALLVFILVCSFFVYVTRRK